MVESELHVEGVISLGGGSVRFEDSDIYGSPIADHTVYLNCVFFVENYKRNGLQVSGNGARMENCIAPSHVEIPWGNDVVISNSDIYGNITTRDIGSLSIIDTEVMGKTYLDSRQLTLFRSTFHGEVDFDGCNIVSIDSCRILSGFSSGNPDEGENSSARISRSFINGNLPGIRGYQLFEFINNTLKYDSLNHHIGSSPALRFNFSPYLPNSEAQILNNIFFTTDDSVQFIGLGPNFEGVSLTVQYNCLFDFDYLLHWFDRSRNVQFDLDSTNLIEDPLFIAIEQFDPRLTENSPCIDAGDPDSPRDLDGTRADMGAFYFEQPSLLYKSESGFIPENKNISFYPNPFNYTLNINLNLPRSGNYEVSLFDVSGRKISVVSEGWGNGGSRSLIFDAKALPAGSCFLGYQTEFVKQFHNVRLTK